MKGLYKAIGCGIVGLMLSGCGEKKVDYRQTLQQQIEQSLTASKLEEIANEMKTKLSERELTLKEFYDFHFEQLRSNGVLSGNNYSDDLRKFLVTQHIIGNRLPIKDRVIHGLNNSYVVIESTPISDEAKKDVDDYNKIKNGAIEHIKQRVGTKRVSKDEWYKLLEEYFPSKHPNLNQYQIFKLKYNLNWNYSRNFVR